MASKRDPFLMTPYSLLRTPEFGRFFDGASIGFIYRYLRTGIWRQGTEDLRYTNKGGYITELAKHYDNGWLASYTSTSGLMEFSGFTRRTINTLMQKLEELKLIRVQEFGDGYIVVLGKKLTLSTIQGYSVGDFHEGYFIDEWESWHERNEVEFREFLIESLAPPAQKDKFLTRLKESGEGTGKILPGDRKNFANYEDDENSDSSRQEQAKVEVENSPRIDKVRIEKRKDPDFAQAQSAPLENHSLYSTRIRESETWKDAEVWAREAFAQDVPLSVINSALAGFLGSPQYPKYPRLSRALAEFDPEAKNPHIGLAWVWCSLHEDITGVAPTATSGLFKKAAGAYKRSLSSQYSVAQCVWTIHTTMREGTSIEFLSRAGHNLITVVKQKSAQYNSILESQRQSKLEAEAEKVREQERIEREKKLAESISEEPPKLTPWMEYIREETTRRTEEKKKFKEIMRGE